MNDSTPGTRPAGLPIPLPLLVLNAVGVAFLAGGILGLSAPATVPALSSPAVAWSLIAVGAAMDLYATAAIVSSVRRRARS